MGDREGKFEYAGQVAAEQAAEYLDRIAAGIRAGHLAFGAGARRASFAPAELMKLEIEAEAEEGKGSVAIELSWKPIDEPAPALEILSDEEVTASLAEADDEEDDAKGQSAEEQRAAVAGDRR